MSVRECVHEDGHPGPKDSADDDVSDHKHGGCKRKSVSVHGCDLIPLIGTRVQKRHTGATKQITAPTVSAFNGRRTWATNGASTAMPITMTSGWAVTKSKECVSVVSPRLATHAPKCAANAAPLASNSNIVRRVLSRSMTTGSSPFN